MTGHWQYFWLPEKTQKSPLQQGWAVGTALVFMSQLLYLWPDWQKILLRNSWTNLQIFLIRRNVNDVQTQAAKSRDNLLWIIMRVSEQMMEIKLKLNIKKYVRICWGKRKNVFQGETIQWSRTKCEKESLFFQLLVFCSPIK